MTDKLHDPKTQGPEHKHPDPYQQDLNPEAAAGQDFGLIGPHPEKEHPRTAYDVKEAHRQLEGFTDDSLKRIPILPAGSRLEQGATYLDLRDPSRREFTAIGAMRAGTDNLYVPKSEVDYQLWNLLRGVTDPARTGTVPGT
jgi:hypothetical protein